MLGVVIYVAAIVSRLAESASRQIVLVGDVSTDDRLIPVSTPAPSGTCSPSAAQWRRMGIGNGNAQNWSLCSSLLWPFGNPPPSPLHSFRLHWVMGPLTPARKNKKAQQLPRGARVCVCVCVCVCLNFSFDVLLQQHQSFVCSCYCHGTLWITILFRCDGLHFCRLSSETVSKWIAWTCRKERMKKKHVNFSVEILRSHYECPFPRPIPRMNRRGLGILETRRNKIQHYHLTCPAVCLHTHPPDLIVLPVKNFWPSQGLKSAGARSFQVWPASVSLPLFQRLCFPASVSTPSTALLGLLIFLISCSCICTLPLDLFAPVLIPAS